MLGLASCGEVAGHGAAAVVEVGSPVAILNFMKVTLRSSASCRGYRRCGVGFVIWGPSSFCFLVFIIRWQHFVTLNPFEQRLRC